MAVKWDEVSEGMNLPELKKNCSTQQLVIWAAASGDFYQIHYDQDFAKNTGLSDIIVHGALKNGFLGQLVHD
jgi:acyl dehydratase